MKAVVVLSRILTVIVLGVALILPAVDSIFDIDPTPTPANTRPQFSKPDLEWSYRSIANYATKYAQYFDDNFGFRSSLLRFNQLINLHIFGVTGTTAGVYGKDGWLFFRPEIESDFEPLNPRALDKIISNLVSYQRWLESRDVEFLIVVVPNKSTIYPEYLPRGVQPDPSRSRLSQLRERLAIVEPSIEIVDIRNALLEGKAHERLYFKTDTHWSGAGQRICYDAILKALSDRYEVFEALGEPKLRETQIETQQYFSRMQAYPGYEKEFITDYRVAKPTAQITHTWREKQLDGRTVWSMRKDKRLPRAVILHDSFFQNRRLIGQLLRESFRELVAIQYVQNAPMPPRIAQASSVLEKREPDVFILEIVERNIHMIADWPPFESVEQERARSE